MVILVLVAGIVFWLQMPRLIDVSPIPDAKTVPAGEPLRLVFSTRMVTESVASHLSIEPNQSGHSTANNTFISRPFDPGKIASVSN
jgi:hypothetical protein